MKSIILIISYIHWCCVENTLASVVICDNFEAYEAPTSKNCFESLDDERRPSEVIRNWGFHSEEYNVYTEDGYRINLVRAYYDLTQTTPLVFGHGIASNSIAYIASGEKSFVYHYVLKGFDVWIINYRGTRFSRGHRNKTTYDDEYWNFSFHQMAIYDLKSALEFICGRTQEKVVYIGFSMGTTISYIYSSRMKTHAEQTLHGIVSMAPVAYLNNISSFLKFLMPFFPIIKPYIYMIGNGEFIRKSSIPEYFCAVYPWQMEICSYLRGLIFGIDFEQIDPLLIRLIYTSILDSIGAEVIEHYAQIITSGQFRERDFGYAQNLKIYGKKRPPLYDLSAIEVPVALLIGKNDWLATTHNAARIYRELSKTSRCGFKIFDYEDYNHNDILEAKDVVNITFPPLTKAIERILTGKCIHNEI